ncbi:hypothetical protein SAMN05443429_10896 [Cruoricaptor ignavus]|uniref:Uncharacterized protein n=1 Tax=Cruoricaptor ignavus TaxID=1118202 RepID=A0A1M6G8J1_9FLAO|nr:hypothetical protein [Cruoricaptor ignavus]SHJ06222.1 hypothetical protein SAMN05443429_10896 [Cruoricaptor ignavus]
MEDGLFTSPWTHHDWAIVILSLLAYLYRMYLTYATKDVKNPELKDWLGNFVLSAICATALYEFALYNEWNLRMFLLPYAVLVILMKDVTDWLFMSREAKNMVIECVRESLSVFLGRFGYTRKDDEEFTL